MIKLLVQLGYFFAWKCRLYLVWSRFYRWLYHRGYRNTVSLMTGIEPSRALELMAKLKWTKDTPKELWDAVGSPYWVQHCIDEVLAGNQQPEGALDCDEFSGWAATCINPAHNALVLNVFWKNEDGFSGHHVCMFKDISGYYHTGNWGQSGPFPSQGTVIEDIIKRKKAKLVGWAIFEPMQLRLIDWGYK
jgi:hypothetical protein